MSRFSKINTKVDSFLKEPNSHLGHSLTHHLLAEITPVIIYDRHYARIFIAYKLQDIVIDTVNRGFFICASHMYYLMYTWLYKFRSLILNLKHTPVPVSSIKVHSTSRFIYQHVLCNVCRVIVLK